MIEGAEQHLVDKRQPLLDGSRHAGGVVVAQEALAEEQPLLHHADRRERGSGRSLAQKAGVHDRGQAVEEAVESASQQLALEVRQDSLWWNKPIVLDTIGGENVIAYNYVDQAIIMGTRWQENALDGAHQTFSHFDLFEGNWAPNVGSDSTHGNAGWMTFFRNYTSGRNSFSYNIGESQP